MTLSKSLENTINSLLNLKEEVEEFVENARQIELLLRHIRRGDKLIIAVDTAELVRHFLPLSEIEIRAYPQVQVSPDYIKQQIALAFLFGTDRPFGPGEMANYYVLLPPYELELADYLTGIAGKLNVLRFVNRLSKQQSSVKFLRDLLGIDTEQLSQITQKTRAREELTEDEIRFVNAFLTKHWSDFTYGLRYLGSDLGEELRALQTYRQEKQRLRGLWQTIADLHLSLEIDKDQIWKDSQVWFDSIYEIRKKDPRRLTTCRRDAAAIQYVKVINEQLYPRTRLLLITHSGDLLAAAASFLSEQLVEHPGVPEPIFRLNRVLAYLLLTQWTDRVLDLERTFTHVKALAKIGKSFIANSQEIEQFLQTKQDLLRQQFVATTSASAIEQLHNAVERIQSAQMALRGLPPLRKYVDRAERAAEALRDSTAKVLTSFLNFVAGDPHSMEETLRVQSGQLVSSFDECREELISIMDLGKINLRKINDETIKGYTPVFTNSELEHMFNDIVGFLLSDDPGKTSRVFTLLADAYVRFFKDPELRIVSSYVLLKQGNWRMALFELRKAVAQAEHKDRPQLLYLLMVILRIIRNYQAAWRVLTKELKSIPELCDDEYVLREEALLRYEMNPEDVDNIKECLGINNRAMEKAQRNKKLLPWLYNNAAYYHIRLYELTGGDEELAVAERDIGKLKQIADEENWIPPFVNTYSLVLFHRGQAQERIQKGAGEKNLKKALSLAERAVREEATDEDYLADYRRIHRHVTGAQ